MVGPELSGKIKSMARYTGPAIMSSSQLEKRQPKSLTAYEDRVGPSAGHKVATAAQRATAKGNSAMVQMSPRDAPAVARQGEAMTKCESGKSVYISRANREGILLTSQEEAQYHQTSEVVHQRGWYAQDDEEETRYRIRRIPAYSRYFR